MTDPRRTTLAVAVCMATASSAWAHAFLDHAEPAVGSQARVTPSEVKVWFTERLEAALSRLQVFDGAGQEVDRKDVRSDPANPSLLEVSVPALKPGKYKVTWRAVSTDTHTTTGTFAFEILP